MVKWVFMIKNFLGHSLPQVTEYHNFMYSWRGHKGYASTTLCHQDSCWCPGAEQAPGHQQPPCYIDPTVVMAAHELYHTVRILLQPLTLRGQVTHICISKLSIIGPGNGLLPGWHQAIIWTNAGILLTGPLGTDLSEIFIEICTFIFKKMHLKMSCAKWRLFCRSLHMSHKLYSWG